MPPPRWLLPSRSRFRARLGTIYTSILSWLKRLTWKSAVGYLILLYTAICLALGVPLLASRLPGYTGPFGVGAIDLEVPLPKPQRIADAVFKDSLRPAFDLETVLLTIYYPVDRGVRSHKPRLHWIPRPLSLTATGYARFAHADNFVTRPLFRFALWLVAGPITIPAEVDVPLCAARDRHPVVVFSHGMASSRTDYTNYLGELASRGTIVAALEHRDGSSPGSYIKVPDLEAKNLLHFKESQLFVSRTNSSAVDTPAMKRHQLAFRDAEIFETIRILRRINANESVPCSRSAPTSLPSFKSRLDMDLLITAGHSYGATSALQAVKNGAVNPSVGGIALDPGKESGPLNAEIDVPLLVVHSNSWSKTVSIFFGRPHFDTVRDLAADVLNRTGAAWFFTSLGTSHPSVTDAPLVEPLLLKWTTGASLNVKEALKEYVHVSHDFITFLMTKKADGLLKEQPTHREYDKWVSEERKASFPKGLARLWEVHVSPASP
jgi:platelet-activating factor acetylhydrolase